VARRSGFPRGRSRSSGVARSWESGPGDEGVTSITATGSAIMGVGISTSGGNITLLRTRGLFHAFIRGVAAGDGEGVFGAVGIGRVAASAFAVGVTAVPTPITDMAWDGWLWHSFFSLFAADTTFGGGPDISQRIEIDSKAMRKFDPDQTIYAAIEVVEIGTVTVNAFLDTRVLVQDAAS